MRIVDVRFTSYDLGPLKRPFSNSIIETKRKELRFVDVVSDEGVVGTAFASAHCEAFGPAIRERIVGEDPRNFSRLWHKMFTGWRKPVVKGDAIAAIGAVDNALWDLRGKIDERPVYQMLGGFSNRVPAYAAGGYYATGKDHSELVDEMCAYVSAGYRAVKMKVGGAPISVDVARVGRVREAIGPNVKLMVDANSAWTVAEAVQFGRAVEHLDLAWFEEPCRPDDIGGMADLAARVTIPIAGGEVEYTRWGFRDLIEQRAVAIVQADPQTCGGLTEWMRIATLASAHHLKMAPHGNHYLGAHALAAVDNGLIVESYAGLHPWQEEFIEGLEFTNGDVVLPDDPGLGMSVDYDALKNAQTE